MKPLPILLMACLCGCGKQEPFVLQVPSGTNQFSITRPKRNISETQRAITIEEIIALTKEIKEGLYQMQLDLSVIRSENKLLKDAFKRIDYLACIYQSNGVGPWVYLMPLGTNHTANWTTKP